MTIGKKVFIAMMAIAFGIVIVCSVYVGVKSTRYIVNQKMDSETAYNWAVEDLQELLQKTFLGQNSNNSEDYWETEITVNKYIDVVGCISLKFE